MSEQPLLLDAPLAPHVEPDARFVKHGKWSRQHIVNQRIAQGYHPLGHAELASNGETCGTCCHATHGQRWNKCAVGPQSGGPATDLGQWWPACTSWRQAA